MTYPPLGAAGEPLGPAAVARYSRHLLLPEVGFEGQARLAASRVAVVGAGGLGSATVTYLAAAGVGTLGIIDDDRVEASNLQRQVIHGESDVGRLKTESAEESVARINPGVDVIRHDVRLEAANALEILGGYDLVVDGADNFPTRYLVNDACVRLGIPDVWGSIFRFDGQVSVWWA
ncbi:MAG TPA: ThiF family adenylyltransferase, partial [Candidatus Lustribacter sp.]|nr:ThiF family adenylyltransferase [Candidatus Lustribacter sp.]